MSEIPCELRISGYVALTLQTLSGVSNVYLICPMGPGLSAPLTGAHAHFGVLSLLAVITGLAIERTELGGRRRTVAICGVIVGQCSSRRRG